jgi:hypothetical protein
MAVIGPTMGFLPANISACSLFASGAMVVLCAQVDLDIIQLLGHWCSDEMLHYRCIQDEPVMCDFAHCILVGGSFTLIPNQTVPIP